MLFQTRHEASVFFSRLENSDCLPFGFYQVRLEVIQQGPTNQAVQRAAVRTFGAKGAPRAQSHTKDPFISDGTFIGSTFFIENVTQGFELSELAIFSLDRPQEAGDFRTFLNFSLWRYDPKDIHSPFPQGLPSELKIFTFVAGRCLRLRSSTTGVSLPLFVFFAPDRTATLFAHFTSQPLGSLIRLFEYKIARKSEGDSSHRLRDL